MCWTTSRSTLTCSPPRSRPRTKAIIPVDMGGLPAHYDRIMAVAEAARASFVPATERQRKLGRPLVVTDAAHSIGATYRGVQNGNQADATVFSLHSVKNVTTGEGGAICLNFPDPFDNDAELVFLRALALNGQTKSAFEEEPDRRLALRHHRPGPQGQHARPRRCGRSRADAQVPERAAARPQADLPPMPGCVRRVPVGPPAADGGRRTRLVRHLFLLRIAGADEARRDAIIDHISAAGVGVERALHPDADAHPVPRARATSMADYPRTFGLYQNEITLPLYNGLTDEQVDEVVRVVVDAVEATGA